VDACCTAINQFYNAFRQQKKADIRANLTASGVPSGSLDAQTNAAFDALVVDFRRDVPGVNETMDWLEALAAKHITFQLRQHQTYQWNGGNWDCYGVFRTAGWFPGQPANNEYQLLNFWWYAGGIGYAYAHYIHLMTDNGIRMLRTMAMAALVAMDNINIAIGATDWHSQAQWLIRHGGTTSMAYLLKRSDDVLKARGSWSDALDLFSTDKVAGTYSTADAITAAEARIATTLTRVQKNGLVEYLSSYQGASMQEVEMGMMHAASPTILNSYQTLYQLYWADLALNYHPGSNSFPGPSSRTYDLVAGAHNASATLHCVEA
jgi:hypothetical protein